MASNLKIGTEVRNAIVAAVTALIDSGGPGILVCRTGAPPTNVGDVDSGTLLATLTFSATSFGAPSTGVATANAITSDSSADASGTVGHFRIKQAGGTTLIQGTAGNAAATPDLEFDVQDFVAGGVVAISTMTITAPIQ